MKSLSGRSILVVDDEPEIREILMESFIYYGATVVGAESGSKALEILRNQEFDVVLSDVRMPDGDGLTLMKNIITQISKRPKLYLCSGFCDVTEDEALSIGVLRIFGKPFESDEIVDALVAALKA